MRLAAALAVLALPALAHEQGEPYADWYNSLSRQDGAHCCGTADCRTRVLKLKRLGDGAEVTLADGRTLPVEPKAILQRQDNPTGDVVACVVANTVICLIRSNES